MFRLKTYCQILSIMIGYGSLMTFSVAQFGNRCGVIEERKPTVDIKMGPIDNNTARTYEVGKYYCTRESGDRNRYITFYANEGILNAYAREISQTTGIPLSQVILTYDFVIRGGDRGTTIKNVNLANNSSKEVIVGSSHGPRSDSRYERFEFRVTIENIRGTYGNNATKGHTQMIPQPLPVNGGRVAGGDFVTRDMFMVTSTYTPPWGGCDADTALDVIISPSTGIDFQSVQSKALDNGGEVRKPLSITVRRKKDAPYGCQIETIMPKIRFWHDNMVDGNGDLLIEGTQPNSGLVMRLYEGGRQIPLYTNEYFPLGSIVPNNQQGITKNYMAAIARPLGMSLLIGEFSGILKYEVVYR